MIKILVLIGKTASGKDCVTKKLAQKYGYKRIVTYTTRPMRKNEKKDITYHYISEADFKQRINEGFFAEWKQYNTEFGVWYYGASLEDLEKADDKTMIILTPNGYRDLVHKINKRIISIYLYANNSTIKKRMIARGDDQNEAERRLKNDNNDFKGIENEVDKIVYNNDGTDINDVVDKIIKMAG